MDDLEKETKTSFGNTYWFDRYSQKIDRLPILHVDPELLDFGEKTAQTLRVMSGSRKGANISGGLARTDASANGGGSRNGGYRNYDQSYRNSGYGGRNRVAQAHRDLNSDINAVNAAKARAAAGATNTKIQGFKLITDATVEMRRTLTERYNVEF